MAKIYQFNPYLTDFRKMWREDRWQFSKFHTRLSIKRENVGLDLQERLILDAIDKVIEENDGEWMKGYSYSNGVLTRT